LANGNASHGELFVAVAALFESVGALGNFAPFACKAEALGAFFAQVSNAIGAEVVFALGTIGGKGSFGAVLVDVFATNTNKQFGEFGGHGKRSVKSVARENK